MMNKSFTVNVYGQVSFYDGDDPTVNEVEANAPDLADGMIPIKYNYVIDEWVKADVTNTNNDWYDYYNKMWANAVMVTSDTREEYMNADIGTTVSNDDILAYYVWIPRYKYVLFNVHSESISPREIQIEFQKETDTIYNGTQNGEYLTHPAFWWDNNSDGIRDEGEELAGIWVGKFKMAGASSNPKMKPNLNSAINNNVKYLFDMSRNFKSTEYLSEIGVNSIDSHMTKNMEWGAVTYLSYSRYGINSKISGQTSQKPTGRTNNYTYDDFIILDENITRTKEPGTGTLSSTTGNIYGIYDMVVLHSSSYEYVMGVMSDSSGAILYSKSGFNNSTMPEIKYYDLYGASDVSITCSARKLGDATCETKGWHGGSTGFPSGTSSWFTRGSNSIFGSSSLTGTYKGWNNADIINGARSVVVLP